MLTDASPPVPLEAAHPVEIRRIYVDAHMYGSGLARALMAAAMRDVRDGGGDVAWLGTNQGNERAIRFYVKCGFSIVGERTFTVGGSIEDDYVLAADLADAAPGNARTVGA